MEISATVPGRLPGSVFARRRAPVWFIAMVLVSSVAGLLAQDWIAAAALWVLLAGWRGLRLDDGPPVLAAAFTFQWVQVTAGIYYYAVTGNRLQAMDASDYRPMVLIGLGCLLALLVGLRGGMWLVGRLGGKPATGPEQGFSWRTLIVLYVASVAITGPVQELAWSFPALTQGILALTYARFALLFLLFRRLSTSPPHWMGMIAILAAEVALGFTGYFAGFREPIMLAAIALTAVFDRRSVKHWLALGALGAVALVTGTLWLGIRVEYRKDFESQVFAQSREARLDRILDLTARWVEGTPAEKLSDVELFVDRLWAVYYPALAVSRVPGLQPHEDGAILWQALWHLVTPRLLFPEKERLESDSEMVFRYTGVLTPGAGRLAVGEQADTSIAFGYAGESYVDFGVPLMFLPVLVFGLLMGAAYRSLFALISYRELAIAVTTVTFWLSLYLFERSWIRMLGLSLTFIIYLGGATVLLDRFLLWHHGVRRDRSPARTRTT